MIFYDTETCGLFGMPVLLQYAIDDGPIQLYSIWQNPIHETLSLIQMMMSHEGGLVGFNLAFDHFHLCKIYTIFSLYHDYDAIPEDIIDELAELEMRGRDGPALKPVKACDLMLVARKTTYQSTMDRHDIRIKRVPTPLAWQLASELERRVILKDIYFARRSDKTADKWNVYDITDEEGIMNPDFKDVVLKFAPSSALKALAIDALGKTEDAILLFTDVEVDHYFRPEEVGWAPFAKAIGTKENWKGAWPSVIKHHIRHWAYNSLARKYAALDVEYTRDLYYFFKSPELGDVDSDLACMVATIRWRGFKVDIPKLKQLKEDAITASKAAPTAPSYVKAYIWPHLSPEEKLVTEGSTKKVVLEQIAADSYEECEDCIGESCEKCKGTGELQTEAGKRAQAVLDARTAGLEIVLYDKLIQAGRFHASFKVIGTLSSRMSGADGLNPQGIKNSKEVRSAFLLAFDDYVLCGGDFKSFEVAIAEAVYNDLKLREDLLTCSQCSHVWDITQQDQTDCPKCKAYQVGCKCKNDCIAIRGEPIVCKKCNNFQHKAKIIEEDCRKKIHGLFAESLFPEEDYDSILATKGTDNNLYTKGKQGVFSQMYGGNEFTLMDRLRIGEDTAIKAKDNWLLRYPGVKKSQRKIEKMFCSMTQPDGFGKKVYWTDPHDYVESLLGFKRHFTLENMICKALFDLAEKPPKGWENTKIKVTRRDREQTAMGASRSALFGAAFCIQSANVRAAANHVIQSTGAQITKILQWRIWQLQPNGIHNFVVIPLNVHDEILSPCKPEIQPKITKIAQDLIQEFRPLVPLIGIDWSENLNTWADK